MRARRIALVVLTLATTMPRVAAGGGGADRVPATVVFLGDSLTVGATPVLQERFSGPGLDYLTIFNAAGFVRASGSDYWSTRLSSILSEVPGVTAVVITLGTNDALNHDVDQAAAHIDRIVAAADGTPVVWATVSEDLPDSGDDDRAFNEALRSAVPAHPDLDLIEFGAELDAHLEYVGPDGIHWTRTGDLAFADAVARSLGRVLAAPVLAGARRADGVALAWPAKAAAPTVTGHTVLRDGSPLAALGPAERSFIDTTLAVGAVADYTIVTQTDAGPTAPSRPLTAGPLPAHAFADVGAWYDAGARWLDYHEIAGGWPDGTFRGRQTASRAQLAMMLWRMAGRPDAPPVPFTDVAAGSWAASGIAWAADRGLVSGLADATFRPDQGVTRGQALAWLWGLVGHPPPTAPPAFTDVPSTAWNAGSVAWADEQGIVRGFPDGTFRSSSAVTRAQLALWLYAVASSPDAWASSAMPPCTVAFPTDPGCEP